MLLRRPSGSPNEVRMLTFKLEEKSGGPSDGRRLRALTVVDAHTREALAIDVDQRVQGEQVVEAMIRIRRTADRSQSH